MRIVFSLAVVVFLCQLAYSQDFKFDETLQSLEENLIATSPDDTLSINQHIENALADISNTDLRAEILLVAGTYLVNNYFYTQADSLLEQCLSLSKNDAILAEANFQAGTGYMYRDIRLRSIKYFHTALDYFTIIKDSVGMGKSLDRIADNHNYIGEHSTARLYYDQCIEIFTSISDTKRLSNVLGNIGGMFSEDGIYDSSLVYYHRTIEIDRQSKDTSSLSTHIAGLAIALEGKGEMNDALEYFHQAYSLAFLGGDEQDLAYANQHLGYLHFRMGNYDSADYYMEITYEKATKMSNAQLLVNSMEVLHQVAAKKKNHEKAYDIYKEANQWSDSLLQLENVSLIASLRSEYELQQKESENSLLQEQANLREEVISNQSKLNITLAISAIALALAAVALLLLNRSRRRKNRLIQKDRDLIRSQAEKLKELDDYKSKFFANISHDIRTPLSLIQGFSDLIKQRESDLSEESKEYITHIGENVDRLTRMTDEINQLIQLEENRYILKYADININKFFGTLGEMFQSGKSGDKVTFHYQSRVNDGQILQADRAAIEKIIFNILGNAFKYNTTGSKVVLDIEEVDSVLKIRVTDDGHGIEEEKIGHIFDRYYRTSSGSDAPKGQGIGLSLTKDLVELHGGQISVSSQPDMETCFVVVLPLQNA